MDMEDRLWFLLIGWGLLLLLFTAVVVLARSGEGHEDEDE